MQNRRDFIKTILAGSTILAIPPALMAFSEKNSLKLVILHTSDTHSNIEPFPANDTRNPNVGGVARRAGLINKIRSENEHVILFDSGDIFQGTPYFNYFNGKLDFELMSKLKYDAATLGNHEFDNGIEPLVENMQYAKFPFVNSNYDFSETSLNGKIEKWLIFNRGKLRIGTIGLGINPVGLITKSNYKGLIYKDPLTEGDSIAKMLKEEKKCDFIVAISHLGYDMGKEIDDKKLAAKSRYIDLILGGHSHKFMKTPEIIYNLDNKPVIVQHSGMGGLYLGRLDFTFFKDNVKMKSELYTINN